MFGRNKTMLTNEQISREEAEWAEQRSLIKRQQALENDQRKYKKKIPTSKILIIILFINCILLQFFVGWVTIKTLSLTEYIGVMPDFAPLLSIIGIVLTEGAGYAIYSIKSAKENSKDGIVYDLAMKQQEDIYQPQSNYVNEEKGEIKDDNNNINF